MGILNKDLAKKHEKLKVRSKGSVADTLSVETGFSIIDYKTATICETKSGEQFLNIGIPQGKIIELIGNSQGGKSTLAYQIGVAMSLPYGGDLVVADYERSSDNFKARLRQITGITSEEYEDLVTVYKHPGMTTEFFKQLIFDIIELKKNIKVADMLDWQDINGEPVKIYPPTIVVLDSVPAMKPAEVLNDATLDNNMIPSKIAAANSALLKTIINNLEHYNITVIAINHITTKIVTNAYAPKKVQLPGLGQDENLPGGNCWSFLPTYIFKITSGKELKADKTYTDGRETEVRILKTRSGFNNSRLKFILDSKTGFNSPYTMLEYAKENSLLQGSGRGGYNVNGSDIKFTLKKFLGLYKNNSEFKEAFNNVVENHLLEGVNERYDMSDIDEVDDLEDEFMDEFEE